MARYVVGDKLAYREHPGTPLTPVRPVEVVKVGPPKTGKIRVQWLDGEHAGLEEWVHRNYLVESWDRVDALLEDERRHQALSEFSDWVPEDSILGQATRQVFDALPTCNEMNVGWRAGGRHLFRLRDAELTCQSLGLSFEELRQEPFAYTDREGEFHASFAVALGLAKQLAARFPENVVLHVQHDEDTYRGYLEEAQAEDRWERGKRHEPSEKVKWAQKELTDHLPVFELVREWCGEAAGALQREQQLRDEIERLRELVGRAAEWMRADGQSRRASLLLKELDRRKELAGS